MARRGYNDERKDKRARYNDDTRDEHKFIQIMKKELKTNENEHDDWWRTLHERIHDSTILSVNTLLRETVIFPFFFPSIYLTLSFSLMPTLIYSFTHFFTHSFTHSLSHSLFLFLLFFSNNYLCDLSKFLSQTCLERIRFLAQSFRLAGSRITRINHSRFSPLYFLILSLSLFLFLILSYLHIYRKLPYCVTFWDRCI